MGEILNLKRWWPAKYETVGGHVITMELGRLMRGDARPIQRAFVKHFERVRTLPEGTTDVEKAQASMAAIEGMVDEVGEERMRGYFEKYVRNVQGLAVDGEAVTSGAGLFDLADDMVLQSVLMQLNAGSGVSQAEAKTSASRSTSPSEESGTDRGESPAPSTEREAGPTPSTAMETPVEA